MSASQPGFSSLESSDGLGFLLNEQKVRVIRLEDEHEPIEQLDLALI